MKKEARTRRFIKSILCIVILLAGATSVSAAIPAVERQALIDLYNATNGDNWKDNSGWKTPPLNSDGFAMSGTESTWHGVSVNNDVVTEIRLYSNSLTGTIPDSIRNLTNLTELSLYHNQLTGTIPEWIGSLTNLTELVLRYNQLMGTIPDSIRHLTKLTNLFLNHNQLSGTIPWEIGGLIQLTHLELQENNLGGEVPASIKNLTALSDGTQDSYGLNLCGNRLFTNDLSVKAFLDSRHENGDFQACQDTILPETPQSTTILTQTNHSTEVKAQEFIRVYGASSGSNEIHVAEQGRLKFMHAIGHNTIVLEENSQDFQVWRSGATVYFESSSGTRISIPATQTNQTIQFADQSFALGIQNGKVMLNSQVVLLERQAL